MRPLDHPQLLLIRHKSSALVAFDGSGANRLNKPPPLRLCSLVSRVQLLVGR
jgi:hypothetical protein